MLTRTVAGRTYDYSHSVGGRFLKQPVDLEFAAGDVVYMLGRQYEVVPTAPWNKIGVFAKVAIFTIPEAPGEEEFVSEFSTYGDADGQIIWPTGIALDSHGNVYVTDEWMNRVSIFDKDGNFLSLWGSQGAGDGEFNRPSGIAIDDEDNLFIVDSLNHRVQKLSKDGQYLAKWGSLGSSDGELNSPWGITIDHQGYVYVADHKNHRAQKFTPEGEYVASFGSHGTGKGQLNRPSDVAVDPDGDVYVCDWANHRVQAFDADGKFFTSFVGDAQQLSKWHQAQVDANVDIMKARRKAYTLEPEWRFTLPSGVAFDAEKGRLLVAESQRDRVQIYNKLKDYLEPQFNL